MPDPTSILTARTRRGRVTHAVALDHEGTRAVCRTRGKWLLAPDRPVDCKRCLRVIGSVR